MREIRFVQRPPGFDRRHFVDEDDVRVVLGRLPTEVYEGLTTVRFDDRGAARRLGYVPHGRREINLCAQPPRSSLSGARGVRPEAFGAVRGSAGRIEEAIAAHTEAIEHYPGHALALERLGVRAYAASEYERARDLLTRALEIDPRLYDANLFLAMAQGRQEVRGEARAQFERAMRVAENRDLVRLATATFADTLGEWGENEEAERLFRKVLATEPDQPLFLRQYARVLWDRDVQESIRLLERAVALDPEGPLSHHSLGAALMDLGDKARAREHLEIALRLRPSYTSAAELLKELGGS